MSAMLRMSLAAFCFIAASALCGEDAQPTLIGVWQLDGDANDLKPGHNGKLVGRVEFSESPIYASKKSRAAWLNGVDAFIQVDSAPELNVGTGDFSLSVWILALENRHAGIVSKGGGPGWSLVLNG